MPAQVAAAAESCVGFVQMLRIQVVEIAEHTGLRRADTGVRRRDAVVGAVDLAAEAADVGAQLEVLGVIPAGASRYRQHLGEDVEIERREQRRLLVSARDVVEERVPEWADIGIVGSDRI